MMNKHFEAMIKSAYETLNGEDTGCVTVLFYYPEGSITQEHCEEVESSMEKKGIRLSFFGEDERKRSPVCLMFVYNRIDSTRPPSITARFYASVEDIGVIPWAEYCAAGKNLIRLI